MIACFPPMDQTEARPEKFPVSLIRSRYFRTGISIVSPFSCRWIALLFLRHRWFIMRICCSVDLFLFFGGPLPDRRHARGVIIGVDKKMVCRRVSALLRCIAPDAERFSPRYFARRPWIRDSYLIVREIGDISEELF